MSDPTSLHEQLRKAQTENDVEKERFLQQELGKEFLLKGNFVEAIESYKQALDLARRIGNREDEIDALNRIGDAYIASGNPRLSIEFYEQALHIARQIKDIERERDILRNLGSTFDKLGEPSRALEFYEQVLAIVSKEQLPGLGHAVSAKDTTIQPIQPTRKFSHKRIYPVRIILFFTFILVVFSSAAFIIYVLPSLNSQDCNISFGGLVDKICVTQAPDKEYIGLSYGAFAFDTSRSDGVLKRQAAGKLKAGDTKGAKSLWQMATSIDASDAEAFIYLENQRVIDSGRPYITVVVATTLSGSVVSINTGRDSLQGAYLAQKEFNSNNKLSKRKELRLLIANLGDESQFASYVVQEIVNAKQADSKIVGVMGLTNMGEPIGTAIDELKQAHIPLVSPTIPIDTLIEKSPYFFSVAPSIIDQATAGAKYAQNVLHVKTAAIFFDPGDSYSANLADKFNKEFTAGGNSILVTEFYTEGQPTTIYDLLRPVLLVKPDLIYIAGLSGDTSTMLNNIDLALKEINYPETAKPRVMASNLVSNIIEYSDSTLTNFKGLYFTAFTYPDTWKFLNPRIQVPAFFTSYSHTFDPKNQYQGTYGYALPNSTSILSYDATQVFLKGCNIALDKGENSFTGDDLRLALTGITGMQSLQGVGGQISFGVDGGPVDKAVVILFINSDGSVRLESVAGRFLKAVP